MNKKIIFYSFLEIIFTIIILKIFGSKSSKILTLGIITFYSLKSCYDVMLILNSENSLNLIEKNLRIHLIELVIIFIGHLFLFFYILFVNTYVNWQIILLFVFNVLSKETLLLLYINDDIKYFDLPKKLFTFRRGFRVLLPISFFFAITIYFALNEHANRLYFLWISFGLVVGYLIKKTVENKISFSKLVLSFLLLFLNLYTIYAIYEFSYIIKNFPLTN